MSQNVEDSRTATEGTEPPVDINMAAADAEEPIEVQSPQTTTTKRAVVVVKQAQESEDEDAEGDDAVEDEEVEMKEWLTDLPEDQDVEVIPQIIFLLMLILRCITGSRSRSLETPISSSTKSQPSPNSKPTAEALSTTKSNHRSGL